MGCIYLVRCEVNEKGYTGKTMYEMEGRRCDHERNARRGSKLLFHCALRKYGFDAFEWNMIFDDVLDEELNDFERVVIRNMGTKAPNGYNLTDGGDGGSGLKHTMESRQRMSVAQKALNKKLTVEQKRRISETSKGRKHSEETKRRLSLINTGRCRSEETKRKISESKRGKEGRPLTEETKRKISKAKRGRKHTEETKRKISENRKGKGNPHTEETRKKMSDAHKGKSRPLTTEETKRKISESQKKRWRLQSLAAEISVRVL